MGILIIWAGYYGMVVRTVDRDRKRYLHSTYHSLFEKVTNGIYYFTKCKCVAHHLEDKCTRQCSAKVDV